MNQLTSEEITLLNSPLGLKHLLSKENLDITSTLVLIKQQEKFRQLQVELVKLQSWAIENKKKMVVLFEGRDAAGKGGAIRKITASINPRYFRIVALPKPTEEEEGQWYFQRYVNKLPRPGEIVFFDRSWYNRAIVEPVNGFCTPEQYQRFMGQVNAFEKMILESNTFLIKFYLSISKKEQAKRFTAIRKSPLKKWRLTAVDQKAQQLWEQYTDYKIKMFDQTDQPGAPWVIVDANQEMMAPTVCLQHILKVIPYKD